MRKIQILLLITLIPVSTSIAQFNFHETVYVEKGMASYYADSFNGKVTASGEKYKDTKLTAAHLTLPMGTKVKVTNLENEKVVEVIINDRGPFVEGRILDLSKAAAEKLDFINAGLAKVKIETISDNQKESFGYTNSPMFSDEGFKTNNAPGKKNNANDLTLRNKEFYEFNVNKTEPKGYGVQIGSFSGLDNLLRITDALKGKYKSKVTVQVSKVNRVRVYKIVLGQFEDRVQAEKLRKKLLGDYDGCFIVDFKNL